MNKYGNTLIEASAGTGKTYSLATHFIYLMVKGVAPDEIIAITFTRAAAYEIYQKLVERLAKAASSDEAAAEEAGRIREAEAENAASGDGAAALDCSRECFAELLSRVIAAQHIDSIATIDSFILRMVKYFPLELGFQGPVDMIDDRDRERAQNEAVTALANMGSGYEAFVDAFAKSVANDSERSVIGAVRESLSGWRERILDDGAIVDYTAESMMAAVGIGDYITRPVGEVEKLNIYKVASPDERGELYPLMDALSRYPGASTLKMAGGIGKKIIETVLETGAPECTFNRKPYSPRPELSEAIVNDIKKAVSLYLYRHFQIIEGKIKIAALANDLYEKATVKRGRLTFGDLPRAILRQPADAIENLQFRFDERLSHWAIDEFQDTSRDQWWCLKNLVNEAATDPGRTATIVGDIKQAIYGWRGGDEGILITLADEARSPAFCDPKKLVTSYRYGENTVKLINAVFSGDHLKNCGLFTEDDAPALEEWSNANCWMEHKAREGAADYVCVYAAPKEGQSDKTLDHTVALAKEIWRKREETGKTDKTIAILVRTNKKGIKLADALRKEGVNATYEGESTDADHPVVAAFLSLLHLSEHPQDTYDREVVLRTPIRTIFDTADIAETAALVSRDISHLGLARTLRTYIDKLQEQITDDYSRRALDRLVVAAIKYEESEMGGYSVDNFIDYFAGEKIRDVSDPSTLTIMSIHRSKGLGFDWVIVPLIESNNDSINKADAKKLIQGDGWLLDDHVEAMIKDNPVINAALKKESQNELKANLHAYYVALTRSKEALWIVAPPTATTQTLHFRDILYRGLGITITGTEKEGALYEAGTPPFAKADTAAKVKAKAAKPENATFNHPSQKAKLVRKTPSQSHEGAEWSAGAIFKENYGEAAAKGTEIHALLAQVEWLPSGEFTQPEAIPKSVIDLTKPSSFRNALVKPEGVIDLWREKSFELATGGAWTSGQLDRVVFTEQDGVRRARIYDYKSNKMRDGETADTFANRMTETYSTQMQAYITAVSSLTGIDKTNITATLLLLATQAAVRV